MNFASESLLKAGVMQLVQEGSLETVGSEVSSALALLVEGMGEGMASEMGHRRPHNNVPGH